MHTSELKRPVNLPENFRWSESRSESYTAAIRKPGTKFRFQTEQGFAIVVWVSGSPPITFGGEIIEEAKPGYWYEAPEPDHHEQPAGIRIYNEENQAA